MIEPTPTDFSLEVIRRTASPNRLT